MKIYKRMMLLVLAVLLAAALPLNAAADAWIPPDTEANSYLQGLNYYYNDCFGLNAFVSNYVEANVKEFEVSETSDDAAIAATMKHFELNARLFSEDISSFVGDDGKTYMKIAAAKFEERLRIMYGRKIAAEDCPGYQDGYIIVSAENYNTAIQVLGIVSSCVSWGDGYYYAEFQVYYVPEGVDDHYGRSCAELEEAGYQVLGGGNVVFYHGDPRAISFRAADFQLQSFYMYAEGIPCTNRNLPMNQQEDPTEAATEATAEAATDATTEAVTEESRETDTEPRADEPEKSTSGKNRPSRTERSKEDSQLLLIGLVVLVILVAVLALVIILLVFKRKK